MSTKKKNALFGRRKIKAGQMAIDDVPARWHDAVAEALEK